MDKRDWEGKMTNDNTNKPAAEELPEPNLDSTSTESGVLPPPAGLFRRLGAFLVDLFLLAGIIVLIGRLFENVIIPFGFYARIISITLVLAYFTYFASRFAKGKSPGKRIFHISVRSSNGGYLEIKSALYRSFFLVLVLLIASWPLINLNGSDVISFFTLMAMYGVGGVIALLLVINRKSGQSLHDLAAGSRVVYDKGKLISSYPVHPRVYKVWMILGLILLITLVFWLPGEVIRWVSPNSDSLTTATKLLKVLSGDPRFAVNVSDYSQQIIGDSPTRSLTVTVIPFGNPNDAEKANIINDVVSKVMHSVSLTKYQNFSIKLAQQLDLGFFVHRIIWNYISPTERNSRVDQVSILGVINLNAESTPR
jgi:uncharacterized RDD family membrane protein YckC